MTDFLDDHDVAKKKIEDFLEVLKDSGGLDIRFSILACNGQVQPDTGSAAGKEESLPGTMGEPGGTGSTEEDSPAKSPEVTVEFSGPDTPLLLARNAELLNAMEHIAAKILRLEPEAHDRISFDAAGYKANRGQQLHRMAEVAIREVRETNRPYAFPIMSSRERRMLHLELASSGLPTASSGDGPRRFVVLYPDGPIAARETAKDTGPSAEERVRAIRARFRRR